MESGQHIGKIVLEVDPQAHDRPVARSTAPAN